MDMYFVECSTCGVIFHEVLAAQPEEGETHTCKTCRGDLKEHEFRY